MNESCVKGVQVYLSTVFKVQGATADGDNLSPPSGGVGGGGRDTSVTWLQRVIAGVCRFYRRAGRLGERLAAYQEACRSRLTGDGIRENGPRERKKGAPGALLNLAR